jgi:hypothetical protein
LTNGIFLFTILVLLIVLLLWPLSHSLINDYVLSCGLFSRLWVNELWLDLFQPQHYTFKKKIHMSYAKSWKLNPLKGFFKEVEIGMRMGRVGFYSTCGVIMLVGFLISSLLALIYNKVQSNSYNIYSNFIFILGWVLG